MNIIFRVFRRCFSRFGMVFGDVVFFSFIIFDAIFFYVGSS